MLTRILAGASLRQVARAYGISPERVRQIIAWQAREANPVLYDDLMLDIVTVSLVLLREHAAAFGLALDGAAMGTHRGVVRSQERQRLQI